MSEPWTTQQAITHLPLKSIRVEVIEGPDAGAAVSADSGDFSVGAAEGNTLRLTDNAISRFHVELTRCPTGILLEDHGSTNGTFVGDLRLHRAVLRPGAEVQIGSSRIRITDGETVDVELHSSTSLGRIRGASPSMRQLMSRIRKASQSDVPVLVIGESGTGKELIAEALHEQSKRSGKPFITVDCASLSPTLIASELFGHEKGAFTGAERQHAGAFEQANGGTIFLDEIGELPKQLQPNLLGALERRRFRRLGGQKDISVDVRVVAATNRDLRREVNDEKFRLDLYYRLAVVTLQVAPLRERPEDVELLVEHFLRQCGHGGPVSSIVPRNTMNELLAHRWPGNVRELRNLVEASVAMDETPQPQPSLDSDQPTEASQNAALLDLPYKEARAKVLHDFETRYLSHLMDTHKFNVSQAARAAKMDRSHLRDLVKRHQLK